MKRYSLLSLIILASSIFVNVQPFATAESDQHTFNFSYHHNFGVPKQGAAFNVWKGGGNFKDGILTGKGYSSATYSDRRQKTILEMIFRLSEPYELDSSGDKLTMNAVVETSTMPSFPVGAVFKIVIEEGFKQNEGTVCYILPSESGCQSPATVVVN